jgi:hypothetical protein
MPRRFLLAAILLAMTLATHPQPARAQAGDDYLLERTKVSITSGKKRRLGFRGRWQGPIGTPAPAEATLRIVGGPSEGDSGLIRLPADKWALRRKGKILRYRDPAGSAGGIRKIVLKMGKKGGSVRIDGGKANWAFDAGGPQSRVAVILSLSGSRWCAELSGPDLRSGDGRVRGAAAAPPPACPCGDVFDSTWQAVQVSLFERHGCTQAVCHGASPGQGNLDLRADVAYANLVNVDSFADPSLKLVRPGNANASMLWRKLAAATRDDIVIPNSPMPSGLPPISEAELAALGTWIYNGAPETTVVPGTAQQLSSCLPPAVPQKIDPPIPPDPSEGVEFHSPPWDIPTGSEDEVCFAFPYDFSAEIPAEHRFPCPDAWGGAGNECFAFNRLELTQDPNSHHSIWRPYRGVAAVDDPAWGPYECRGGANDGLSCDPTRLDVEAPLGGACGPSSVCVTPAFSTIACITFGPPDVSAGMGIDGAESAAAPSVLISTQPFFQVQYPQGVANVVPVQGQMIVNSHAFNLTDQPVTNEQWLQAFYPDPAERKYVIQDIFDAEDIFIANVPAFAEREYCRTITFDKGTRVFELYSHTHKRGRLFRAWLPPNWPPCSSETGSCMPVPNREPALVTTDYADPDHVFLDGNYDSDDPAERTIKYCAIYDNGFTDPSTVKRRSIAQQLGAFSCTNAEIVCTGGPNKGQLCGGDDANCPDAACDACPVRGGVTTDDEMFILLGSFYCPEDTSCYEPLL